ncbi:tripartite motif-containing protein 45 [Venturia canescens]|uniref:tripartite motif-containing protein 45 n=1 Tax=Venturia canescens TaxID=32260 RepID=UPI001C9D2E0B|nr:tripartite motif-containing protein 45 [Venturia canescens]
MYPEERTDELIDLLKINSGRIESLAKCCGGGAVRPSMETEQFEMNNRPYDNGAKETFIFGSWKRKNRRRIPTISRGTINIISINSDSDSNTSQARNNKPEEMISESQGNSTYRPASYESSFCDTETRSVVDPIRDSAIPTSESEILEEDDFWCPRCGGRMNEPRILECLHPICTPCVDELLDRVYSSKCSNNVNPRWQSSQRDELPSYRYVEGCPICDCPLPSPGDSPPPPHYPLQHRLVMNAVRRRLSHRVLCCDVCPEEVQASVHCPTCLRNFCTSCGDKHEISQNEGPVVGTISRHEVRPLWEAKRFRRTALCLEHPSHSLRFHCIACRQVTCRECMWRGSHRGHASEGATSAGRRATTALLAALQRGRNLLNSLLIEYNNSSFSADEWSETSTSTYFARNNRYSDEFSNLTSYSSLRSRRNLTSYAREAQERIHEFARLQRARYLLDAISLTEELLSEGSDVEILSLSRLILKRLHMLGSNVTNEIQEDSERFQSRPKHTGLFHCCTFCSSGGKKEATCACRGTMPGGYKGCGHGHPGHPRVNHWSCCGSTNRYDGCSILPKLRYQVTL